MKKPGSILKKNDGFTLVELIVVIFIITFVIGAVMGVFVTTIHARNASERVTSANAAAQKFIENLYGKNYAEALSMQGVRMPYEGFYLTFALQPANGGGNAPCAHLVFRTDGGCLIAGPDGRYAELSASPYTVSVTETAAAYSITYDGVSLNGGKSAGNIVVIVNAMETAASTTTAVTLGAGISAIQYCRSGNEDSVVVTGGTVTLYKQTNKADQSLARAIVEVYTETSGGDRINVVESLLQLNNG